MDVNEMKNEIVAKSTEAAVSKTNEAVETKTAELNEKLETKASKDDVASMAKQLDEIKEMTKSGFGIGAPKRSPMEEMSAEIRSKGKELKNNGQTFSIKTEDYGLTMKDFAIGSGATSDAHREAMFGGIQYDPNYQTRLTNFLEVYNVPGTGAFRYNQESARTDAAAPKQVTATLGESSYTVNPVIEDAVTVGAYQTVPREHLEEITGVDSYLMRRMTSDVLDAVDRQILRGSGNAGNWKGLNTQHAPTANRLTTATLANAFYTDDVTDSSVQDANNWDVFNATAAELEGDNFKPDLVILNPIDYRALSWIKTTGANNPGEYLINQAMAASQPFMYFRGLRIVPNAAQNAGTFTLVDTNTVGVFMQKGMEFEFGLNGTDFSFNHITARAITRGGTIGFRPNGIVTGDLAICVTAIDNAA